MIEWIVRILFVLAGFIASLFVTRDALNFPVVQMIIAIILFTLLVAIIAFWPVIKNWFKRSNKP